MPPPLASPPAGCTGQSLPSATPGKIYDRNLGALSPLKIDRGLNDLWTRGGLMYPLPLR